MYAFLRVREGAIFRPRPFFICGHGYHSGLFIKEYKPSEISIPTQVNPIETRSLQKENKL